MSDTITAAVLTGPQRIEVDRFAIPETGDDDAMLRIEACGGCGSDIGPYLKGGGGEGSLTMKTPLILGHEIVGRVENLGSRAAERWGVEEGDRVIIERWIPCGHCEMCYAGNYRKCVREVNGYGLFYGGTSTNVTPSLWGGFADYLYLHPDSVVYKVSDSVPAELYPLFTPLSNGISWLQTSGGAGVGSTVLIQGPGPAGLGAVIAARAAGARQVIVTGLERDSERLSMATEMGATHTIAADQENVAERVADITGGRMADVVLEATSGPSTEPVGQALELAAEGGTVVLAGMHGDNPASNLVTDKIVSRTLTVKGVWGRHREAVFAAIALIESGEYPLEKLCTHTFSLEAAGEAMETVAGNINKSALHVSVVPEG